MAESKLTAGEVEITLGGETYTLKPTLRAALTVSKFFEGFAKAHNRLVTLDLEAVIIVIQAGLGAEAPKDLSELVYASGIATMTGHAVEFVGILANGGKRYEASEDKANPQTAG